jgi:hypothetical protein
MADFLWYKTAVSTDGTALADSVAVTVWFGPAPPPPGGGPHDLVIIDTDADGLIDPAEWQAATGTAGGGNLGGTVALFDFTPPKQGNLYTAVPYSAGDSGLLDGLTQNFVPVDPDFLAICFAAGTAIDTPEGPRAIETLLPGDLVLTLDHGAQPIRSVWHGGRPGIGPYTPVRIAAGTLGATRDLLVSRNHRLLIRHPRVALLFAVPEALVMAKSLAGYDGFGLEAARAVTYVHLLLDRHEIVRASGVLAETFFPGSYLAGRHGGAVSDATLFGAAPVGDPALACRSMLTHAEGRLLASLLLPRAAGVSAPERPPVAERAI